MNLTIQSHAGPYVVRFSKDLLPLQTDKRCHFIVDSRVFREHRDFIHGLIKDHPHLEVEASEENKSLDRMSLYVQRLVGQKIRRDHLLVAVGGGIIQDITCFLASVLLRGVPWRFYPTTLLAQADSCIGSKSSINCGGVKNIVGTFYPAEEVTICTPFLNTLTENDLRSGIGEMIKVHLIDGPSSFDQLASVYPLLKSDRGMLLRTIRRSLEIKTRFIEEDEFDRGPRQILNYGHSFGHAIEAATHFEIPHGVAVTIGMDMANQFSVLKGWLPAERAAQIRRVLLDNAGAFVSRRIDPDAFFKAIDQDKKNTSKGLSLIVPDQDQIPHKISVPLEGEFTVFCRDYFKKSCLGS